MSKGIHIVVADDNTLYHGSVHAVFQDQTPEVSISLCETFSALKKTIAKGQPASVILLEISITGLGGLRGILALRSIAPTVPIIIVSDTVNPPFIHRAMELGASGFVSKLATTDHLLKAVESVISGQIVLVPSIDLTPDEDSEAGNIIAQFKSLTRQQARVLGFLGEGLLNKQIAFELSVSEATVKAHVSAILQKLNVESRTQAVATIGRLTPQPVAHSLI